MKTIEDIHQQFAECFNDYVVKPYAYFLSKNLLEGNICINIEEPLVRMAESPYKNIPTVDSLQKSKLVGTTADAVAPFILQNNKLYLHRYYHYETIIVNRIKELVETGNDLVAQRMEMLSKQAAIIQTLNSTVANNIHPDLQIDWQLAAALQVLTQNFSIITGGPGTGKTTTLAKVLRVLYAIEPNASIALAAPTGKASMRMYESLNNTRLALPADIKTKFEQLKPSTIHSLLGYIYNSVNFKYNSTNQLPFDWIIVDEASMIDVPMFAKLLQAMNSKCRLILLGDKDQLASVEAGSLLGDLCLSVDKINQFSKEKATWINAFILREESKIAPHFIHTDHHLLAGKITELKYSHRFNSDGGIGKLSKAILNNEVQVLEEYINAPVNTNVVIDTQYHPSTLQLFAEGYIDFIQEPDIKTAIQKLNNLRILVAVREGEKGLYAINKKIETILREKKLINADSEFYHNRPIMVTKNMYEFGLFNGDVGIIRNGRAYFEVANQDQPKAFLPAYITSAETVFAMTIHKSQGSEFKKVFIVLPEGTDNPLLTKELLYTGVTRAKDEVTIQAAGPTILHAANATVKRTSGIRERLG
jgi:exodeoxyribonuclease V alpha subunit